MKNKFLILIFSTLISTSVIAQTTSLKCTTSTGAVYGFPITLNFSQMTAEWLSIYRITSSNEKYITLVQQRTSDGVGSAVIVLNRRDGKYLKTEIINLCNSNNICDELKVKTESGTCIKNQQF
jgi:hypothetical protein